MGVKVTEDGVARVSIEPAEGTSVNLITPNWCDKNTWYHDSHYHPGFELTDSGDHTTYSGVAVSGCWVDNYHGRYSDEDTLKTHEGYVPRLKVYVDGVEKTEQDPHLASGGDYTVDYCAPSVTFLSPLDESAVVTADIFTAKGSTWTLKPDSGKKLKIKSVEAQFSVDVSIKDTLHFETFGYVQVFAPALWQGQGGPYPTDTLIPISEKIYKTMQDYINEANGAMPQILKTTAASPTWRDLTENVQTFPWEYQTVKTLVSSYGMETRIYLSHDTPFDGQIATATFYCLSVDE